jgi:hypothetical protein
VICVGLRYDRSCASGCKSDGAKADDRRKKVYRHTRKTTWPVGSVNLRETRSVGPKRLCSFDVELFGDRTLRAKQFKMARNPFGRILTATLHCIALTQRNDNGVKKNTAFIFVCTVFHTRNRTTKPEQTAGA